MRLKLAFVTPAFICHGMVVDLAAQFGGSFNPTQGG